MCPTVWCRNHGNTANRRGSAGCELPYPRHHEQSTGTKGAPKMEAQRYLSTPYESAPSLTWMPLRWIPEAEDRADLRAPFLGTEGPIHLYSALYSHKGIHGPVQNTTQHSHKNTCRHASTHTHENTCATGTHSWGHRTSFTYRHHIALIPGQAQTCVHTLI